MISLIIFLICLGIPVFFLLLKIGEYLLLKLNKIRDESRKKVKFRRFIAEALYAKTSLVFLGIALVIFILASIIPYLEQQKDAYLISYYTKNIKLFNKYINEYTESAQKQIEEYDKLRSQMARAATPTQLQFWAEQVDVVGNKLTERIKEFKDKIIEQEVSINQTKSRMEFRPNNKWFFGFK